MSNTNSPTRTGRGPVTHLLAVPSEGGLRSPGMFSVPSGFILLLTIGPVWTRGLEDVCHGPNSGHILPAPTAGPLSHSQHSSQRPPPNCLPVMDTGRWGHVHHPQLLQEAQPCWCHQQRQRPSGPEDKSPKTRGGRPMKGHQDLDHKLKRMNEVFWSLCPGVRSVRGHNVAVREPLMPPPVFV